MEELARLVGAYAAAVDARDVPALRALFLPDATLTVRRGESEPQVFQGHEGLAGVIDALTPFDATLHEVSSLAFAPGPSPDEATGSSVCVAHHLRAGDSAKSAHPEASDLILHGRYNDHFRLTDDTWHFTTRELRVLWTEKRPVRPA
jgi:hypothetical protein